MCMRCCLIVTQQITVTNQIGNNNLEHILGRLLMNFLFLGSWLLLLFVINTRQGFHLLQKTSLWWRRFLLDKTGLLQIRHHLFHTGVLFELRVQRLVVAGHSGIVLGWLSRALATTYWIPILNIALPACTQSLKNCSVCLSSAAMKFHDVGEVCLTWVRCFLFHVKLWYNVYRLT